MNTHDKTQVSSLSERLRQQAAEGRSDTLDMAQTANDLQLKIRNVTRKIMAAISELSMYQVRMERVCVCV